ncbi:MAG: hypothetical protein ABIK83_11010 [Candidatus Zixiibacteriota bacterium]
MPGLSLLVSPKLKENDYAACLRGIADMRHDDDYRVEKVYGSDSAFLGFAAYPEYPRSVFDLEKHLVLLEGAIYDLDDSNLKDEMQHLAEWCDDGDSEIVEGRVKSWLMERDGPFVIVVISKESDEVTILPDALGQLPLFHAFENGQLLVSREHKFIVRVTGTLQINPIGTAEQLIYGFPLHSRTHHANIWRFLPGTCMRYRCSSGPPRIITYWNWSLSQEKPSSSIDDFAQDMACRFKAATIRRAKWNTQYKNVVGLSGGLDSRGVLAGLSGIAEDVYAVTSIDHDGLNKRDVVVANEVARFMHANHVTIDMKEPIIDDMRRLSYAKDGINSIVMAGSYVLYDEILRKLGRKLLYYTGDGGLSMKTALMPGRKISNAQEMLSVTMMAPRIFEVSTCANLLGIAENDIAEASVQLFESLPEETYNLKHARFMMLERENRLNMEGLDRNRLAFWTAAPFYSLPVFTEAMRIDDRWKAHYNFIRRFLAALKPGCEAITYADIMLPITSIWAQIAPQMKSWIVERPAIRRSSRRFLFRDAYGSFRFPQLVDALTDCVVESQTINDQLDAALLRKLLDGRLNKMQLMNIGTLIMYMHEQERVLKS